MANTDTIELNEGQKQALEILSSSQENVFLTGFAGTGKTFLIKEFLEDKDQKKAFPFLGSTGISALNISGRTFHSFFGLGMMRGSRDDVIQKAVMNKNVKYRLRQAKCILIDEVSMLSGEVLDVASDIAKYALEDDAPWGGIRVIAVGDFAQLPPVSRTQPKPWAFLSNVWSRSAFTPVVLTEQVRSEHAPFQAVLNKIRLGDIDDGVEAFFKDKQAIPHDFSGTRLFSRRNQALAYNMQHLEGLPGSVHTITTNYSGKPHYIEALKKNAPVMEKLFLKIGAKVMIRVNDPMLRYVNGSTGTVLKIKGDSIRVAVDEKVFDFEKMSFAWMDGSGEAQATATNYPLQLAWSTTIHKSQGLTLDEFYVDLKQLWEPGHAYVALSRARDPEKLYISGWHPTSIKVDPVVKLFYERGCPSDFFESMDMM